MTVSIIAANEKGGVGKTTLCYHLAYYLADQGYRVLAIDLDPQGNLSFCFTGENSENGEMGRVYRVLVQEWPLDSATYKIQEYDGRFQLLSGNKSTGSVRNLLSVSGSHLEALVPLFKETEQAGFDFVVIDTPPSPSMDGDSKVLDALVAPAFYAADFVLVPVLPEQLSLAGLAALSRSLVTLHEKGSSVSLLGVVPMMYDGRTKEHAINLLEIINVYGPLVYPVISNAVAVTRSPVYGLPVWAYDPQNQVSTQLRCVGERVVKDVEAK